MRAPCPPTPPTSTTDTATAARRALCELWSPPRQGPATAHCAAVLSLRPLRCAHLFMRVPEWRRVLAAPSFLFFDERILPRAVLREAPASIAFVVGQMSDSLKLDAAHSLSLGADAGGAAASRHPGWLDRTSLAVDRFAPPRGQSTAAAASRPLGAVPASS